MTVHSKLKIEDFHLGKISFCVWLCSEAGCLLWGNSILSVHICFLPHFVEMTSMFSAQWSQETGIGNNSAVERCWSQHWADCWTKATGRSGYLHICIVLIMFWIITTDWVFRCHSVTAGTQSGLTGIFSASGFNFGVWTLSLAQPKNWIQTTKSHSSNAWKTLKFMNNLYSKASPLYLMMLNIPCTHFNWWYLVLVRFNCNCIGSLWSFYLI